MLYTPYNHGMAGAASDVVSAASDIGPSLTSSINQMISIFGELVSSIGSLTCSLSQIFEGAYAPFGKAPVGGIDIRTQLRELLKFLTVRQEVV